ncbi:hypothetical protein IFT84_17550 [Rhizobium sp. CFBP 8762]|uniref:helix-turn-helix domain-containing protein n=1 Tax=Rhizobium sp. CFBP 8762 TaxID=2775279 RepID=UPI00177CC3E2|nr:helix-turn-helix domain-containing protein [Rhizobium sp. CFBP 8762]MBD8556316.1 hypothetical protein [Rhizobium sp. CFBP 8762]
MNTDLLPVHTPTSEAALRAGYADSRRRLMNGVKRTPAATVQIETLEPAPKPKGIWTGFDHNFHIIAWREHKLHLERVAAHKGEPIETLYQQITLKPRLRPSKLIIMEVLERYPGVTHADVVSPSRARRITPARQEAMYWIHKERGDSYGTIGRLFGRRDHTTVMWAVKQVEKRMAG